VKLGRVTVTVAVLDLDPPTDCRRLWSCADADCSGVVARVDPAWLPGPFHCFRVGPLSAVDQVIVTGVRPQP
jgi:hypothetical protein